MHASQKFHRGMPAQTRIVKRRWYQCLPYLGAIALVVVLIWTTSKYHNFVTLGYEITELRDTNQTLKVEQEKLKAELARMKRPDRIMREMIAMGLQRMPPSNRYTVYVQDQHTHPPESPKQNDGEEVLVAFSASQP